MFKPVNKYFGVRYRESCKKYVTYIYYRDKDFYLGYYDDERTAAWVVDTARYLLYGPDWTMWNHQNGRPNFKPQEHPSIPSMLVMNILIKKNAFPVEECEERMAKFKQACKRLV